ncbi:DUF2798 domain-containing protein [Pseudorhodoplanes sp.]|uniref:DUF2798 domain-containing protein n=1 Tax=Pseudorhodoplanes sp. TaxID=1934341 RepID=UPI003D0B9B9E
MFPRRYSHFIYGVLQSGLTCAVASAITTFQLVSFERHLVSWIASWFLSWLMMLPIVVLAAPIIKLLTL